MKNFVPRLINGTVIFVAGGLTVVAAEAVAIGVAVKKAGDKAPWFMDAVEKHAIPSIKDIIYDGVETILFGTSRRERKVRYTDYSRVLRSRKTKYYSSFNEDFKRFELCFPDPDMAKDYYNRILDILNDRRYLTVRDAKNVYMDIHDQYNEECPMILSDLHAGETRWGWTRSKDIVLDGNVVRLPEYKFIEFSGRG